MARFWLDGRIVPAKDARAALAAAGVPAQACAHLERADFATKGKGEWAESTYKKGQRKGQPCQRHSVSGRCKPIILTDGLGREHALTHQERDVGRAFAVRNPEQDAEAMTHVDVAAGDRLRHLAVAAGVLSPGGMPLTQWADHQGPDQGQGALDETMRNAIRRAFADRYHGDQGVQAEPGSRRQKWVRAASVLPGDTIHDHQSGKMVKVLKAMRMGTGRIYFTVDDGQGRPYTLRMPHGTPGQPHEPDQMVRSERRGRARFCDFVWLDGRIVGFPQAASCMIEAGLPADFAQSLESADFAARVAWTDDVYQKGKKKGQPCKKHPVTGQRRDLTPQEKADRQTPTATPVLARPSVLREHVDALDQAKRGAHQAGQQGGRIDQAVALGAGLRHRFTGPEAVALARHAGLGDFTGREQVAYQRLAKHVENDYYRGKRGEALVEHASKTPVPVPERKSPPRRYDATPAPVSEKPPARVAVTARVADLAARVRQAQDAAIASDSDESAAMLSRDFLDSLSDKDVIDAVEHLGPSSILSGQSDENRPKVARTALHLKIQARRWFSRLKGGDRT